MPARQKETKGRATKREGMEKGRLKQRGSHKQPVLIKQRGAQAGAPQPLTHNLFCPGPLAHLLTEQHNNAAQRCSDAHYQDTTRPLHKLLALQGLRGRQGRWCVRGQQQHSRHVLQHVRQCRPYGRNTAAARACIATLQPPAHAPTYTATRSNPQQCAAQECNSATCKTCTNWGRAPAPAPKAL
jgi:hypothetical protein